MCTGCLQKIVKYLNMQHIFLVWSDHCVAYQSNLNQTSYKMQYQNNRNDGIILGKIQKVCFTRCKSTLHYSHFEKVQECKRAWSFLKLLSISSFTFLYENYILSCFRFMNTFYNINSPRLKTIYYIFLFKCSLDKRTPTWICLNYICMQKYVKK